MSRIATLSDRPIIYSPKLKEVCGTVNSALLFSQMVFWGEKSNWSFYKFSAPSKQHLAYKKGDSWQEELGFSRAELDGAFKKLEQLNFYITKRKGNVLWYYINPQRVDEIIDSLRDAISQENLAQEEMSEVDENPFLTAEQKSCIKQGGVVSLASREVPKVKSEVYSAIPTIEAVEEYIAENKYNVDAKYFFEYYNASNWQGVKNWKQKIITWHKHSKDNRNSGSSTRKPLTAGRKYEHNGKWLPVVEFTLWDRWGRDLEKLSAEIKDSTVSAKERDFLRTTIEDNSFYYQDDFYFINESGDIYQIINNPEHTNYDSIIMAYMGGRIKFLKNKDTK